MSLASDLNCGVLSVNNPSRKGSMISGAGGTLEEDEERSSSSSSSSDVTFSNENPSNSRGVSSYSKNIRRKSGKVESEVIPEH